MLRFCTWFERRFFCLRSWRKKEGLTYIFAVWLSSFYFDGVVVAAIGLTAAADTVFANS